MASRSYLYDDNLLLKDAGLVESSAAATVSSAAKILDLGASCYMEGVVVIDVSALEIASNDEVYDIVWQLSPDATFGTATNIQDGPQLNLSAKEVKRTDSDKDDSTGRYYLPVTNEQDGTLYRYARLYTAISGSIAGGGGINYTAYLSVA